VTFVNPPNPLPAGVTNPLKVVKANEKNDVMVQSRDRLVLNRWGNPSNGNQQGLSINVQHKRDGMVGQCMILSNGGRVRLAGSC
jgi:hypothetical protein